MSVYCKQSQWILHMCGRCKDSNFISWPAVFIYFGNDSQFIIYLIQLQIWGRLVYSLVCFSSETETFNLELYLSFQPEYDSSGKMELRHSIENLFSCNVSHYGDYFRPKVIIVDISCQVNINLHGQRIHNTDWITSLVWAIYVGPTGKYYTLEWQMHARLAIVSNHGEHFSV